MASFQGQRAYLDYNATAPLRPEARAAMVAAFGLVGNPSSIHAEGRAARAAVEEARRAVAEFAGAPPRGIVFASSATEAANLALNPALTARAGTPTIRRLVVGAGEHACVLSGHRFARDSVTTAPLDGRGALDLEALAAILRTEGGPALLALQGANNETGVVQPLAEAAAMVHAQGGLVVCDAVQLAGRARLAEATAGADILLLSAHKFGGPKGAGALISMRAGLQVGPPLLRGGGQERGLRAGTENVAGIVGFGAAARAAGAAIAGEAPRLTALRDRMEALLRAAAPDAVVFGAGASRLPNTTCFAIPGLAAATLLIRLDMDGVAASSGSACSSGKVATSHVLTAMGIDPALASGAIRLSLGWASEAVDVERFGAAIAGAVGALRRGAA